MFNILGYFPAIRDNLYLGKSELARKEGKRARAGASDFRPSGNQNNKFWI